MRRTLLLALACALASSGCKTVLPYQRSRLMERTMQVEPSLDASFQAHVAELRESAVGASSAENASCGCR